MLRALCLGLSAASVSSASANFLLIPNSNDDTISVFDAFDGSLVKDGLIDVGAAADAAGVNSTPIEVLEVNGELWVSDQVADRIWRFAQNGALLGDIGAGELNNIRGMELVGSTLYVAQGSAGTTTPEGVITIDTNTLGITGSFGRAAADISYQDIFFHNGELLITNSDTGNDGIERWSLAGADLGNLVSSDGVTGLDFGQQISARASNGNLLVGGFSPPSGVFEYLPDGTFVTNPAGVDFGPRAAFELGNGEVLWTNGAFVRTDADIKAQGASYRYITPSEFPSPGVASALALAGVVGSRRRRR